VWCSSVPSIPHAVVQRFNIKPSIAQVECNPGYKLVGEKKLTCDNSTWSPKTTTIFFMTILSLIRRVRQFERRD
jgi:hypothetical protein